MNNAARNQVFSQMEAQRHTATQAARPQFVALSPAQQAFELMAQMDVATLNGDRAAFLTAQAELKTLVEQL